MALLAAASTTRAQYRAVAQMRWRIFVNTMRTRRGKFELGARIFSIAFSLLISLGLGLGLGFAAWHFADTNQLGMLALLLWPVVALWQMFPVMLSSFQDSTDLGMLLRFPVSFRSYVGLYLLFGVFDPSSLLGGIALLGIWIGTVTARPHLALWTAIALALFAIFNLLLTRMIFAWLDRWLAQRRTREILGLVVLFFFLGLQVLNPVYHQRAGSQVKRSAVLRAEHTAERIQRPLPPALAARAIHLAAQGNTVRALLALGALGLYGLAAGLLLGVRLRAEFRGENLGEAPAITRRSSPALPVAAGPNIAGSRAADGGFLHRSGPIAAILEKELRYLSRSGMMLYSLAAPLVLLFLFGGTSQAGHAAATRYALPVGVAYGFLGLTRLVSNSLGGEGAGIQLYFLSPTPFRTVMLAKNLLQIGLFTLELILVCSIVLFRFGAPPVSIIAVTFCWLLFALPAQLAFGDLLSLRMAYRMTLTRMSREQGAIGNALLSLLIQLALFAIGAGIFFALTGLGHPGLVPPVLLVLAVGAVWAWLRVLASVDRMSNARRETLMGTLVRAA